MRCVPGGKVGVTAVADKTANRDVFVDRVAEINADANIEVQEGRTTVCAAKRTSLGPNAKRWLFDQLQIAVKIITVLVKWQLQGTSSFRWTKHLDVLILF